MATASTVTKNLVLSGAMFEPVEGRYWKSLHNKAGAHYNNYACHDEKGMDALREFFPSGEADPMNFCVFSTSGVHGTYITIEEVERWVINGECEQESFDEDYGGPTRVTFLIIQPRICCLRGGNCAPRTTEDFEFLKRLRATSWDAVQSVGREG